MRFSMIQGMIKTFYEANKINNKVLVVQNDIAINKVY